MANVCIYDVLPQCENACDDENDNVCRKESIIDLNALDIYKEGQQSDYLNAVMHEICEENVRYIEDTATNKTILCLAANYSKTGTANALQNPETTFIAQDDRMITTDQLRAKVSENNKLSPSQQEELFKVLSKYQRSLTKRPGRCTEFDYEFKIEGSMPASANSRPIPFALRDQVRDQILSMLRDGILEESYSAYVNPLTLVTREDKPVRICVDARRINRQMVADRAKVVPMRELLQKFHNSNFITSLDLSSAFLQVPLKESSRQWTAFQFQSKVYHFTSTPYGFKNSLSAFIRALDQVLGDDDVSNHVVMYVDDLLIHSSNFTDHLCHLDRVLSRLTAAGFTINAAKCQFCKPEIKFLGHIISDKTVRPDNEKIEAILRYPVPKNQKQLRKFLGVCNFHQQFIVNYASYVEPLLVLLRKGIKWSWTAALQRAFETLRSKFAESIHLVHPDEEKDWIINTDASEKAIGAVLMQDGDQGKFNIVSTASRVLNSAEQRYTTCEKELLAIIYALQRFKIFIYGRRVILNTDNKALTFLNRCAVTSNRVARWNIELQQFDLEIRHIKGVQNHLAEALSRSPSGLTDQEMRNQTRPDQVMVHGIQVSDARNIRKELQTLATLQDADERLAAIKGRVATHPASEGAQYMLKNEVLYCRGGQHQPGWRAMLPDGLERKIFEFVHFALGHLGVDKCSEEIKFVFHARNLGRKLRKFIACCDICQRTKHPNRSFTVEEKHHFPKEPGDVCAVDIYGSLPSSRGGVRYILVCLDVFSKFIKLYALKSATTKACLNKLINHYFGDVITPKVILSDNATQFRSPSWHKQLQQHGVDFRFVPVRHPESNPSERYMRELSKFCRIYCHENHKKWAGIVAKYRKLG
jgi:hypothetical protein